MAIDAVSALPVENDPVLSTLKWIAVAFGIILAAAAPIMAYLRKYKQHILASHVDEAGIALYEQLKEQIRKNSEDIERLVQEKNKWFEEATKLRYEVEYMRRRLELLEEAEKTIQVMTEKLEEAEKTIQEMSAKLKEYEAVIAEQRSRLDERNEAILLSNKDVLFRLANLQNSLRNMEERIRIDEEMICQGCQYKKQKGVENE